MNWLERRKKRKEREELLRRSEFTARLVRGAEATDDEIREMFDPEVQSEAARRRWGLEKREED